MHTLRATFALAVLFFLAPLLFAQQEPWDAPPFSSDPKALVAAAEKVPAGDSDLVALLDEAVYTYDASGRGHTAWRSIYRVVDESAIERMGEVSAPWAPWFHTRPTIEARVVTKDGSVHLLDKKAIVESPAREESLDIFSDNRIVRAPLPAVAVGSVIEYVISFDDNNPLADAGSGYTFHFGQDVPVQRSRLVLDTPAALEPRIVNTTTFQPRTETKDGRRRTVFETGRIEALKEWEIALPPDTANLPYVGFSTGKSWQEIARRYSEIVDKQIADGDVKKLVATAVGNGTDRNDKIARILAAIQKDVRYAGVEVGESSIIPRSPRAVLANKYGDCKDKATLLVAMLREAGIPARVALLRAGWDLDVHADLPGLGRFNHAIVVVEGDAPLWIDPTDEFARPGELPVQDQGRQALIAGPETAALARTPEIPSSANRYAESRTYTLPEDGKARVVEITEASGPEEAVQRRWYAESDRTKLREQMEEYVKSYYNAKSLARMDAAEPHDLGKPFHYTLEVAESGSGMVRDGEASVAIHPSALFQNLPYILRDYEEPKPGEEPSKKDKKRQHDFLFPTPGVREWTYRIVPPTGFAARQLPQNETKTLGTMTLATEYSTGSDGVIVAKLRLDTGKRRITAAEFEETRVAVGKLLHTKQTIIGFEAAGQTKLAAGDIAGALTEFRRLSDLHPKEAQHHIDLARTLLVGGLGESAREEARRAVTLEPKNAHARRMLGAVLEYDVLGRLTRKGFDRDGAIAAFREAKKIDPNDVDVRVMLCRILTYGDDGVQFGRNARTAEAIDEYRAMMKDLGGEGRAYAGELLMALTQAGRWNDVKALADDGDTPQQQRDLGRAMVAAVNEGPEAGLRALGTFEQATRRSYAGTLAQTFLSTRMYPQAAAMFEAAAQGSPKAGQVRPLLDMLRKTKRVEETLLPDDDPRSVVQKLLMSVFRGDVAAAKAFVAKDVLEADKEDDDSDEDFAMHMDSGDRSLPTAAMPDIVLSLIQLQQEGSDKTGYRIRGRVTAVAAPEAAETIFVSRENGKFLVRGSVREPAMIGWSVLRFADAGDLEAARTWLNWAREDIAAGGGDDPLSGPPFAALWPKGKQTATADEIRIAAAALMQPKVAERTEPVLAALRDKAQTDEAKVWIDVALANVYLAQRKWDKLLPVGERLIAARPDSGTAFMAYTHALTGSRRFDEAEAVAKKRLERLPRDRDAVRALSYNAAEKGDYAAAQKYAEQIVDDLSPAARDYNEAAWLAVFTGQNFERALESARQASNGREEKAAALNTLAALYAETGKNLEAREALLSSIDARNREQPSSADWYVLGRIAENYGVRDAAMAAYKRVKKEEKGAATVWELTEKRLAGLGKT